MKIKLITIHKQVELKEFEKGNTEATQQLTLKTQNKQKEAF